MSALVCPRGDGGWVSRSGAPRQATPSRAVRKRATWPRREVKSLTASPYRVGAKKSGSNTKAILSVIIMS
eukprot:3261867-Pleurochrysis_carterae.AAC.1